MTRAKAGQPSEEQTKVPLGRILRLLIPYWGKLSITLGLICLSSVLALVPPFLLREILDVALPRDRAGLLSMLVIGMLAFTLLANAMGVWQGYLATSVGENLMNDLRVAVYNRLQRMSLAFFTRTQNGEVQSRIANDIGGMAGTITSFSAATIAGVSTVVASLCAMVALDWRMTVVSLLMIPVFVAISRNVGNRRREITRERQQKMALLTVIVEESLSVSGFMLSKVMGRTPKLIEEYAQQSAELTSLTIRSSMTGRWRQALMRIIMAAMPIAIYWTVGITARHHHMAISIGTLVAFTSLQQQLFNPTIQLLQVGITLQSSMAMFERIFEYLDLPVDIQESAHPVPLPCPVGHVRLENVGFHYGGRQVLHDISIDIPAGHRLALVGSTGAGKTTLGYLVSRLYDVTAGRVTIDGVDVRDLSAATLTSVIGVVSQETHLFHTTVADNLRFAKADATDAELVEAAEAAHIHDLIASLPDGYETIVGERGYRFSGGEKQRLAIARAMLRNPRVLILDEATSALDTRTEHVVQRALDRLAEGRTTITIAHRLSTVHAADDIVVLEGGRIVEQGSHAELRARGGHYAALLARSGPPPIEAVITRVNGGISR